MKFLSAMAVAGAVSLTKPGNKHPVLGGIPDGSLMDKQPSHWRKSWPQGAIDDSTDDDKIMNWVRLPDLVPPPIEYHDKMRQW